MPIPAAAIPAITQAGGGIIGGITTALTNRANRKWSEKMYERTKNDNISFWDMQNKYNAPEAQVQRYKDAGLNPALMYGQGNSGNASSISTPDLQRYEARTPDFAAIGGAGATLLNTMYDLEIKQAQIDNLRAQNSVIEEEALLKGAYRRRSEFDLGFEKGLEGTSAEIRKEKLRQMTAQTGMTVDENIRRAALTSKSLVEAAERIKTMQEQRKNMVVSRSKDYAEIARIKEDTQRINATINGLLKDNTLKDLDIELRKQGINPNDPMYARILGRFMANMLEPDSSFNSTTGNIWKWFFN